MRINPNPICKNLGLHPESSHESLLESTLGSSSRVERFNTQARIYAPSLSHDSSLSLFRLNQQLITSPPQTPWKYKKVAAILMRFFFVSVVGRLEVNIQKSVCCWYLSFKLYVLREWSQILSYLLRRKWNSVFSSCWRCWVCCRRGQRGRSSFVPTTMYLSES